MDLKNGNILVWQVTADRRAKQLLLREFPMLSDQALCLARNMPLKQVISLVKSFHIPQKEINRVMERLKKL